MTTLAVEAWGASHPANQVIARLSAQVKPVQSGMAWKRHRDDLPVTGGRS
jgi:hypothetical protein